MYLKDAIQTGFQISHQVLAQVMEDIPPELVNRRTPGSTVAHIGAILTHMVYAEDVIVHRVIQGTAPVCERDGWSERSGIIFPNGLVWEESWCDAVELNLDGFRGYQQAVAASVESWLAGVTDAGLEAPFVTEVFRPQQVGEFLIGPAIWHLAHHTGDVAAIKGMHGVRGLPF